MSLQKKEQERFTLICAVLADGFYLDRLSAAKPRNPTCSHKVDLLPVPTRESATWARAVPFADRVKAKEMTQQVTKNWTLLLTEEWILNSSHSTSKATKTGINR